MKEKCFVNVQDCAENIKTLFNLTLTSSDFCQETLEKKRKMREQGVYLVLSTTLLIRLTVMPYCYFQLIS